MRFEKKTTYTGLVGNNEKVILTLTMLKELLTILNELPSDFFLFLDVVEVENPSGIVTAGFGVQMFISMANFSESLSSVD